MYDVLKLIKAGGNKIEMSHVQKILRNGKDDDNFICGIYLVKNIDPMRLTNFINNLQPVISMKETINKIKSIVL